MSYDLEKNVQDFNWALGLNRLSLRLMGVWPDDDNEDKRRISVLVRVPFMISAMFFCLFLPQMYALALNIHELPLVIDNLMTSCAALTSCIKLFFIWRSKRVNNIPNARKKDAKIRFYALEYLKENGLKIEYKFIDALVHFVILAYICILPMVKSVIQDWLRPKSIWEFEAMHREASRARLFTISGYVVLAGCYSGFAFAPLFGFNIRMISNITDYGDHHLLVQSYFPYDYSKSPNYEITHVSQLISGFFIGMSVSIPENYFVVLVFHASAQFEILGAKIENFIRKDYKLLMESQNKEFNRRLGVFIDRHVHLITMVSAVEQSFSFVIVTQIFCMSVMVICLGFQILGMFNSSGDKPSVLQILTLFGTLFTLMMHTLVDCFACETLASRSAGLFYNIYFSGWYAVPQQSTRDLIPMMILSKTPRQLTAGKIFNLSLAGYCSILKSTAGYISMLIAVNGR